MSTKSKKERQKMKKKKGPLSKEDLKNVPSSEHETKPTKTAQLQDPEVQVFLTQCGITSEMLKDKKLAKFLLSFIEDQGGIERIKKENKKKVPAPPHKNQVPATLPVPSPPAPPPPPLPPSQLPSTQVPPSSGTQPPVSQLPQTGVIPVAPPPPPCTLPVASPPPSSSPAGIPRPPPPPISLPMAPVEKNPSSSAKGSQDDPRGSLMDQIKAGTALRPVDTSSNRPKPTDSRNELLEQIRAGIKLRKVNHQSDSNIPSDTSSPGNDLAQSLADALAAKFFSKGRDVDGSSSESDSESDGSWDQ